MRKAKKLPAAHIVEKELLQPYNPVTVNVIGAGGTGSQVLTALARINQALNALNHPGLIVRLFDDDKVTRANLGRQLFTTNEIGLLKSVALINRVNRFFGTNWKAIPQKYDADCDKHAEECRATLTIGCVDTLQARFDIAEILKALAKQQNYRASRPIYYMDFGNSRNTGQVVLSTLGSVAQPVSKKYQTVASLPMVTDEFGEVLKASEERDNTPSCSLAEALTRQDLFINSALVNLGASLLWQLFRDGILFNRGFFLNLQDLRTLPIKVA